jgi:hypothetical protein
VPAPGLGLAGNLLQDLVVHDACASVFGSVCDTPGVTAVTTVLKSVSLYTVEA